MAIGAFLWVRTQETPRPATSSFLRPDDIPYHRYHRYPTLPAQVLSRALALLPLAAFWTIAFISFAYLLHIDLLCITYNIQFQELSGYLMLLSTVFTRNPSGHLGTHCQAAGSTVHSTLATVRTAVDPWPPAISIIPL